jgi:hypothetical protein
MKTSFYKTVITAPIAAQAQFPGTGAGTAASPCTDTDLTQLNRVCNRAYIFLTT